METLSWPDALERYERSRATPHTESVCNAPETSMYFAASGRVAPCWILLEPLGEVWGPDRSVLDIWNGEAFTELRRALRDREFPGACSRCADDIHGGNQPLAAVYDKDYEPGEWPVALELELSNVCNYACLMCNGELSNKIRRNREKLPPLDVPYDDSFVEQITEIMPHLRRVRFSGGEPMLHPIMHRITDRLIEHRPDLRIDISTNGSILNDKVRRLLDRADVLINVSFDSFRPEVYERIRVGSDFARLMANLEAYLEHFREHPGDLTINTNPMRDNWREMPDFVRWCDERNVSLTFNTVVHPAHMTLRTLPPAELAEVHRTYAAVSLAPAPEGPDGAILRYNRREWQNVVAVIERWHQEALAAGPDGIGTATAVTLTDAPEPPTVDAPPPLLTDQQLADKVADLSGTAPVVTIDLDPDLRVRSITPDPAMAHDLGLRVEVGGRYENPLDILGTAGRQADVTVEMSQLDPVTNEVLVRSPTGVDLSIVSRQDHADEDLTGIRSFIAVRSLPVDDHSEAPCP